MSNVRVGTTQVDPFTHQAMCEGSEGCMRLGCGNTAEAVHAGQPCINLLLNVGLHKLMIAYLPLVVILFTPVPAKRWR